MVHLAEQGECADFAAVTGLQCAQGTHHGRGGLLAPQVHGGLWIRDIPVINGFAVVLARRHRPLAGLGQIAGV